MTRIHLFTTPGKVFAKLDYIDGTLERTRVASLGGKKSEIKA
jgi:hypothetical protein